MNKKNTKKHIFNLSIIFIVICAVFMLFREATLENYRELNDLAIVSSIAIDKDENEYMVSAQVLNSKKESSDTKSGSGSGIIVYSSSADTIQEALRNIIKESPKKLYTAHIEMLVISEDVAREGIYNVLDFFVRDNEASKEFFVVILQKDEKLEEKGETFKAKDAISITNETTSDPSLALLDSLKANIKYKGVAVESKFSTCINSLVSNGNDLLITSIAIKVEDSGEKNDSQGENKGGEENTEENRKNESSIEAEPKKSVIVSNVAYFDEDKLIGYIDEEDAINYNIIQDKLVNTIISGNIDEKEIEIEVVDSKTKSKIDIIYNNIKLKIVLDIDAIIAEKEYSLDISKDEKREETRKYFENTIKDRIIQSMKNLNSKYNSDIIGIENKIYKHLNKEYNKNVKDSFKSKYFNNIDCDVEVNLSLETSGGAINKW